MELDAKQHAEEVFCGIMEATEQYLEFRERLSETLKKARDTSSVFFVEYAIGLENVGPLKYSTEMRATRKFYLQQEAGAWMIEEMPENEIAGTNASGEEEIRDPLQWFGMSVPSSLRNAQRSFQLAIPLIVELANRAHVMNKSIDIVCCEAETDTE